jgi:hypothetical protein
MLTSASCCKTSSGITYLVEGVASGIAGSGTTASAVGVSRDELTNAAIALGMAQDINVRLTTTRKITKLNFVLFFILYIPFLFPS